MQYHDADTVKRFNFHHVFHVSDVYFGFYSPKWGEYRDHIENRFSSLEELIDESIRWTKSECSRWTSITIENKLVFSAYWDDFGFNVRRFQND